MKSGSERVVFGHMHEDHALEFSLLQDMPIRRAVVIASGGDLALALAGRKVQVIAVDMNPAQIGLVRRKMDQAGNLEELCQCGQVDRVLRHGGALLGWLLGWPEMSPGKLRSFLAENLQLVLPWLVSMVHGKRAGNRLDRDAVALIRRRLESAMRAPDAGLNPWVQVLLGNGFGGEAPEVWRSEGIAMWEKETWRIRLRTGVLLDVLKSVEKESVGLISVSNLVDVMEPEDWKSLLIEVERCLPPGGFLVVRSMLRETIPADEMDDFLRLSAMRDRSPLCPVVWAGRKA